MVTIEDIRSHVLEDAADLISTVGVVGPLISSDSLKKFGRDREQVAWFLRKLLTRNVLLIVTRLHESSISGRTGETASIDALLNYSKGSLPDGLIDEFRKRRIAIISDLEAKGTQFKSLYTFRTAEMAHSIHRGLPRSDNIFYHTLEEFARATCALVVDIDAALVGVGLKRFDDIPDLFSVWDRRGSEFWK